MATILDRLELTTDQLADLLEANYAVLLRSATRWQFQITSGTYAGLQITLDGTGFTTDGEVPTAGTIRSLTVALSGVVVARMTGLSIDVATLNLAFDDSAPAAQDPDEDLSGADGDDRLDGRDGNDRLHGNAGDDLLIGGHGDDRLSGGAGTDTASYADAPGSVTVSLLTSVATGHGRDQLSEIENVVGSAQGDALVGNGLANLIQGGGGNDGIAGGDGDDRLYGEAGSDRLSGGAGLDTLAGGEGNDGIDAGSGNDGIFGEAGNDSLYGGAGDDRVEGGDGNDYVYGGVGNDRLSGGVGIDAADYRYAGAAVSVDLRAGTGSGEGADTLDGIENVIGSLFGDRLLGDGGRNALYGRAGNDRLEGGDGTDSLLGEAGNDHLYGGAGNDYLYGGAGDDALFGDAGSDYADYRYAPAAVSVDLTLGTAAGEGADTLDGIEHVIGSASGDSLAGDAGRNALYGRDGADVLRGADGADWLYGEAGDDRLMGDAGNDCLQGGAGADTLTGGAGTDYFQFKGGWGADRITDFDRAYDYVDLRGAGLTYADLRISYSGGDALVLTPLGQIALTGIGDNALSASDFLF